MNDDIDKYTYYLTIGLVVLFVCIIFILVLRFVVGFLCAISMTGGI